MGRPKLPGTRERRLAYKRGWAKRFHEAHRAPKVDPNYEVCTIDDIPAGVAWKPGVGPWSRCPWRTFFTIGNVYKLTRVLATGEVTYFRRTDIEAKSPAEILDAEPVPQRTPRLEIGARAWFIDTNARWYEIEVIERTAGAVTVKTVTGWDAEHEVEWPYGGLLEFGATSRVRERIRPITARRP